MTRSRSRPGIELPSAAHVPVLMYHSIANHASPPFRPYVVEPQVFSEHLDAMKDAGCRTVSVRRYVAEGPPGAGEPPMVVLTFDDAFLDFHETVLPKLVSLGFEATLYAPTAYIGGTSRWLEREGESRRPMMSWTALQEAAASGVEIGSHSCSHPQLDMLSSDQLRAEVVDSKHELEDNIDRAVETFAYPFGYYDKAARSAVAAAGYSAACAVRDLSSHRHDAFTLSRWTVHHGMTAEDVLTTIRTRSGRVDQLRSSARTVASKILRRAGLKHRGITTDHSRRPA